MENPSPVRKIILWIGHTPRRCLNIKINKFEECEMVVRLKKMSAILAVVLIMGLLLTGCGGRGTTKTQTTTPPETKAPYKIGAIFDISGPGSSLGIPERDTALMLIEEINKAGGVNGTQIELIIEDNKSDETESKMLVKKLVDKGVVAIIGSSQSGTSMAMIEAVQAAQIPMVSVAARSTIVEPIAERKWVFMTAQKDTMVMKKIVAYLKSKNLTKIGFASVNNKFGDGGLTSFEAAAAKEGITIVAKEKFGDKDTDMTPQITNIKKANPQAVLCWAVPPAASIFTKNYSDLGLKMPLLQSHGIGNKKFIELAGNAANGVLFPIGKLLPAETLLDSDPQKAVLIDYATKFEAKYGPKLGARTTFGGHAWDAIKIVLAALEKAGPDRAKLRDEIEKTQNFVGISGIFNMSPTDHNGLTLDSIVMVEIIDGKWTVAK
jgi:branched-chain amino acid transport system substrate-binding protein